jgi:SnoaL-like domain
MTDPAARRAQLHAIARAYVTEGLGKKNFAAIPYADNVTLRAPLCPGGMDMPLTGKDTLRDVWWAPLPQLIGAVTVVDTYVNDDLTAVTCEFTLEIVNSATTLHILDRFTVNDAGKILEQSNYFDPRTVTNPGWQHA